MSEKKREKLKEYIETGKKPTVDQFEDLIDSCLNSKDDRIEIERNRNSDVTKVIIHSQLQLEEGVTIKEFANDLSGDNGIVPTSQAVKSYVQAKIEALESKLEKRINAIEKLFEEPDKLIEEDLGDEVKLEMIFIPAGTFLMGSPETEPGSLLEEKPQHFVSVPAFYMSKFQVTQDQWKVIANLDEVDFDLNPDPSNFKGNNHPVEMVSWFQAVEFCKRLSLKTGCEYRLPSEAEWEYACRAGTRTIYYNGNSTQDLDVAGWYKENSEEGGDNKTHPVGQKLPNAFGLHDMHGNVYEWCFDHWLPHYRVAPRDGSALIINDNYKRRVIRGGAFSTDSRNCRSASRLSYESDKANKRYGFRVVCAVAQRILQ